jgi:hypothetical protein
MKLGGTPVLDSEDAVRLAAGEAEDGFSPVGIARDKNGEAALARDDEGRIIVIKRHGNRFAGRVLGPQAEARLRRDTDSTTLEVDAGELRFGTVSLSIADAEAWAAAINRLSIRDHA